MSTASTDPADGPAEGTSARMDAEEYVERVLRVVERIPPGRVTTYGLIADAVGRGGPRQVGAVMSRHGDGVPWWRVVRIDGTLPPAQTERAGLPRLEERTPLRRPGVVDVRAAIWIPGPEHAALDD